jgi:hypothetical protein
MLFAGQLQCGVRIQIVFCVDLCDSKWVYTPRGQVFGYYLITALILWAFRNIKNRNDGRAGYKDCQQVYILIVVTFKQTTSKSYRISLNITASVALGHL